MKRMTGLCSFLICIILDISASSLADWNVKLLAGQSLGDGAIATVVVSDWSTAGVNKIYAGSFRAIAGANSERYICEFSWTGSTWIRNRTLIIDNETGNNTPTRVEFCDVRGDGTKMLYLCFGNGAICEYSLIGGEWRMESKIESFYSGAFDVQGYAIGEINGTKYLYGSSNNGKFAEYKWDGTTWIINKIMDISASVSAVNGSIWPDYVNNVYIGKHFNDVNDNRDYLYLNLVKFDQVHEGPSKFIGFNGNTWQVISDITLGVNQGSYRNMMFVEDVGEGRKLYLANNFHASAKAITFGKITRDDPISVYALIEGGSGGCVAYSENVADSIYEYTWMANGGTWSNTWKMKLFEPGMTIMGIGRKTADICMFNGRNELETDGSDTARRLYIADCWGNLWECSVPPRSLRPPDPTGGNYGAGTGSPGSGSPGSPSGTTNRRKPSIMGER